MLSFLKKIFGASEPAPAPYKVEAPKVKQETATTPIPKPQVVKKPAIKAKTARKPKGPKPD